MRLPNLVFQRRDEGMRMAQEVIDAPGFDAINSSLKTMILSRYAAELASDNKLDQAKAYARQVLDITKQGPDAESARKTLQAKPVGS